MRSAGATRGSESPTVRLASGAHICRYNGADPIRDMLRCNILVGLFIDFADKLREDSRRFEAPTRVVRRYEPMGKGPLIGDFFTFGKICPAPNRRRLAESVYDLPVSKKDQGQRKRVGSAAIGDLREPPNRTPVR